MTAKRDNILWERAKNIASSQNKASDWVFIVDIYHYLGGNKKSLYVMLDDVKYFVVGKFSSNQDLLINSKKIGDGYIVKSSTDIRISKKSFVDYDDTNDMIVIEKPDTIDEIEYSGFSFSKESKLGIYI